MNVSAVTFCDRGGIRVLHEALEATRARGAEFRLRAVGAWLSQLMVLAGETDLLAAAQADVEPPQGPQPTADDGDAFALVRLISKSVHAPHRQTTPHEMLRHAAELAVAHVPGAAAAVSIVDGEQGPETVATGPLAEAAEKAQQALHRSPAREAADGKALVHVADLAGERRWTDFTRAARDLGITAMIACDLGRYQGGRAVLSMYGTAPGGFDAVAVARADLLAAYAVLALNQSASVEALHAAVRSRQVIGEATGVLMERHRIDAAAAFAMLVTASQHANVKVRVLAEQVVLTGLDPDQCVTR